MRVPLITLILAVGCGGGEDLTTTPDAAPVDAAPDGGDGITFAPYPGWPETVAVRRAGSAYRTTARQLELDPQGKIWLLRDEHADSAQLFGAPALERYHPDGRLDTRVALDEGALAPGFVVHPSGELTVFVLVPAGEPANFHLDIARVSTAGAIVSRRRFEDAAGPRENLYYDDEGVHPQPADRPLRFGFRSHVVGMADGEGLYLLAWTHGVKLYRMDADGAKLWGVQLMPANIGMAFQFIDERLALDEQGRVYVAAQIFEDDADIYGEHFGRPPLVPVGSYDVLVERVDPDGTFSGAALFGGPGGDAPTGMTARGGEVLVTGGSRIVKHDLPNRTREWDLFVLRGDLDDGALRSYRTLDLARDDFGWAMAEAADGTIYIAGRTDYVQVDTNSEVEDGKGLLLALSPDLERRATLSLAGPRDVQVQALRLAPDGRLLFAGLRDGPLTHTDPAMLNNEGVLGATMLVLPQRRGMRTPTTFDAADTPASLNARTR